MTHERISQEMPQLERDGHEFRYRLAAGYVEPEDTVLDLCCGMGYGSRLVRCAEYIGIDIADVIDYDLRHHGTWIVGDACTYDFTFDYDVAMCFEAIEHVVDPAALIDQCCRARKYVVCSVPIIPTVGINPYHLHDFDFHDLPIMFHDRGWSCVQSVLQTSELSGVYVFRPS